MVNNNNINKVEEVSTTAATNNNNSNNNNVFIQLQSKNWQALYGIYKENKEDKVAAIQKMSDHLKVLGFTEKQSFNIATLLNANFANIADASENELYIAQSDFQDLRDKLLNEPDGKIIKILLSLVAHLRTNYHPSGWIKYERKSILYIAGISKLKVSEQTHLMSIIHQKYGFDMQVVGSNQPIPCYKINWLKPATEGVDSENPLVAIGPSTPSTIMNLLFILFPPDNKKLRKIVSVKPRKIKNIKKNKKIFDKRS